MIDRRRVAFRQSDTSEILHSPDVRYSNFAKLRHLLQSGYNRLCKVGIAFPKQVLLVDIDRPSINARSPREHQTRPISLSPYGK